MLFVWMLPVFALASAFAWQASAFWGHGTGMWIAGALPGVSAALLAGRDSWRTRAVEFAFLGGFGWLLGSGLPYDLLIGYTHSDYADSVFYGVAGLCMTGFLWGTAGGGLTALAGAAPRSTLDRLAKPLLAILALWAIHAGVPRFGLLSGETLAAWTGAYAEGVTAGPLQTIVGALEYHRVAWFEALCALAAALVSTIRLRRDDPVFQLIFWPAVGWWVGYALLIHGVGWRLAPPHSDNWAGMAGLAAALIAVLCRQGYRSAAYAGVMTGFWTGIALPFANTVKLFLFYQNPQIAYENVFHQLVGILSGIGFLSVFHFMAIHRENGGDGSTRMDALRGTRMNALRDEGCRWTQTALVSVLLVAIPYGVLHNSLRAAWIPNGLVPEYVLDLPVSVWFHWAFAAAALAVLLPLIRHRFAPVAALPASATGKAQWLYLFVLIWPLLAYVSTWLPIREHGGVTRIHALHFTEIVVIGHAAFAAAGALLIPSFHRELEPRQVNYGRLMLVMAVLWLFISLALILVFGVMILGLLEAPTMDHAFRFGPNAWPNS